ncbi:MAG: DUF1501 domain-containing protein [Planctomycetota bacterium]
MILLWLDGGPATIDLWDLKPGHAHGGPSTSISTAVAGMEISEHLPRTARHVNHLALVRSMTSREGDHQRAIHFAKTGYSPQGNIHYPTLSAVIVRETSKGERALPPFVSIFPVDIGPLRPAAGYLGPKYMPMYVGRSGDSVDELRVANLELPQEVNAARFAHRLGLLKQLENPARESKGGYINDGHWGTLADASRLMLPESASAFDLKLEHGKVHERYGRTPFGEGCLLARRLVERGTTCVEVTLSGWDTHSNNFEHIIPLSRTLDAALSALVEDLHDRSMLDSTLIVCMGEFGRTPRINASRGRDHWPNVWSAVLAGGGIRGGQTIGSTTSDGIAVKDRPIRIQDLLATICKVMGVDPTKWNDSNVGRPIRLVEAGARPVEELL